MALFREVSFDRCRIEDRCYGPLFLPMNLAYHVLHHVVMILSSKA